MSPVSTIVAGCGVMPARAWLLVGRSVGVERPRRMMRSCEMQRPVRVLGGPVVRAACGGRLSLTWLSLRAGAARKGLMWLHTMV
jgi:hypothetical protein